MYQVRKPKPILYSPRGGRLIVDQTPAQEFNIGANGLPMSDVTAAINAQSAEQFEMLAKVLERAASQPNANEGKSPQDIIEETISSRMQTHSEVLRAQEYLFKRALSKREAAEAAKAEAEAKSKAESEANSKDEEDVKK